MFSYSTLTFSSIAVLVQLYSREYLEQDAKTTLQELSNGPPVPRIDTYDFIIVGGGTAGCVVASRLSENGTFKVLLLEAGGSPPPQLQVPAYVSHLLPLPEVAFQYSSVPQRHTSRAYNNGSLPIRVGKVLGGTSSINGMFFNRGNPRDYDAWARLTEDPSWRYDNVLKYFRKVEKYEGEFPKTAQHGYDGFVTVSRQPYAPGLGLWIEAGREIGYENLDPNGPQQKSLGPIEYTRRTGKRVDSYTAYLKNVEGRRSNLKIARYSTANEIVMDDAKKAIGVSYTRHGVVHFARATNEIILSAGAYGTPQLLLKSGIGPTDELKSLNIKPKHNLPVGQNLLDHPLVPLKIIINDSSQAYDASKNFTETTLRLYEESGEGPLSSDRSLSGQGFAVSSTAVQEGHPDWPDIQFSLYSQDFPHLPIPETAMNDDEVAIHVLPYLGRPRSVGSVKLNAKDINGPPLIDFNFLSDPRDVFVYTEAINKSLEIFETTDAYQRVGARYPTEPVPECSQEEFRSTEYWLCYLKYLAFTGNHAVGTCRMGKTLDPGAVVDPKLRVIGIEGLRVIDASIMPTIVNSNTQAAVYMIAEKVSEELVTEWLSKRQCVS